MASDSAWPAHTEVAPWASARTAHLVSLSAGGASDDWTRAGSGDGRVYDFHGMTATSSGQKLARIFAGKDLVEAARPTTNSQAVAADSAPAGNVPAVSPSVIKPVSFQTGPGDRSMTPEEQAAANQARRDEQQQFSPVPGGNRPSPGANNPPAQPNQNPQPVQNQQPQQVPATTTPGAAEPVDAPAPAQPNPADSTVPAPTLPAEGVPWETRSNNGAVATSVIVPGTGGQTIDTTIRNADGTITQVRSVSDGNGGVTTWTANADGSLSVRYPDGTNGAPPNQAKIYTVPVGQDPSGPAPISTDISADGKNTHTESVNPDGTVSQADSKVRDDGTIRTDHVNPNGSTSSTVATPGANGAITTTLISDIDANGYGYDTDDAGIRWDVTPTSREGFDHKSQELHVQRKEGDNFREEVFDKYGHLVGTELYGPTGSLISGRTVKDDVEIFVGLASDVRKKASDQLAREIMAAHAGSRDNNNPDTSSPSYIAAQQLSDMLSNLHGDNNALIKAVYKDGKIVQVSISGKNGIDHVVSIGEKPGKMSDPNRFLQFDLYPDGSMIDGRGNHLIEVEGSIIRYGPDGKPVIPNSSEARQPNIVKYSINATGKYDFEVEPKLFENTSNRRFVHRPDTEVNAEITEVPKPPGVVADKVYKVAGGGVLIEDASGLHWATDPGHGPSVAEQFESLAYELATLAVLDGAGRIAFRAGAKVVAAFKAREAAALAREAAAAAAAAKAAPGIAANTARTGIADSTAPISWGGSAASNPASRAGLPTEQPPSSWSASASPDPVPKAGVPKEQPVSWGGTGGSRPDKTAGLPKEQAPVSWGGSADFSPVPSAGLPKSGPAVPSSSRPATAEYSFEATVQGEGVPLPKDRAPSAPGVRSSSIPPGAGGPSEFGRGWHSGGQYGTGGIAWEGRAGIATRLPPEELEVAVEKLRQQLLNADDIDMVLKSVRTLRPDIDRATLAKIKEYNFDSRGLAFTPGNYSAWMKLSRGEGRIDDIRYIVHEKSEIEAMEVLEFNYLGRSKTPMSEEELFAWRDDFNLHYSVAHSEAYADEYAFLAEVVGKITGDSLKVSPRLIAAVDRANVEPLEYMLIDNVPLGQLAEFSAWNAQMRTIVPLSPEARPLFGGWRSQLELGDLVEAVRKIPISQWKQFLRE